MDNGQEWLIVRIEANEKVSERPLSSRSERAAYYGDVVHHKTIKIYEKHFMFGFC